MTNNRVERKLINGKLCDVYFDENGEAWLIHWVGVGRLKWGIPNPPVPKNREYFKPVQMKMQTEIEELK